MQVRVLPELTDKEKLRFWSKINKLGEDECWPWIAYKDKDGYGTFCLRRDTVQRSYRSNRIALFLKTDVQREVARHTCDNPSCCNPKHLEWGTHLDNDMDRVTRNRQIKGSKHGMSKINEDDVKQIRICFYEDGMTKMDIGRRFGVSDHNIRAILQGRTWSHVQ